MWRVSWGGRCDPRETLVGRALADTWTAGSLAEKSGCRGTGTAKAPEWALLGRGRHQETQGRAAHHLYRGKA